MVCTWRRRVVVKNNAECANVGSASTVSLSPHNPPHVPRERRAYTLIRHHAETAFSSFPEYLPPPAYNYTRARSLAVSRSVSLTF
jgi:hypothetical protein